MRRLIATAAGVVLVASACTGEAGGPGVSGPPRTVDIDGVVDLAAALVAFDGCEALLDHLHTEGAERVGPYGLDGGQLVHTMQRGSAALEDSVAGTDDAAASPASESGAGSGEEQAFSGTNVQEQGVDEPDLVKTDGNRLVTVVDGSLRVVDVSGSSPNLLGSLALPDTSDHQLFLHDDIALVLSSAWDQDLGTRRGPAQPDDMGWSPGTATTRITEVDLSDPATMETRSTVEIDGAHLSARMVDGTVRLVVRSEPRGLAFVGPQGDNQASATRAAAVNRSVIEESTIEQWLPTVAVDDGDEQVLTSCDQVHTPTEFAGFGALSVVTVDLDEGLADAFADGSGTATVSVLAGGETVYASAESIYVSTTDWVEPVQEQPSGPDDAVSSMPRPVPPPATTELHRFATPADGPATYEASGSVRGQLLNQFSMSEHDGHLRVATTDGQTWDTPANPSESFVTTFTQRGGELAQVGQVGGLGKDERIYAVRFLGDVGYVVTFRQVDPLYTVDLSDPADPRVTGELKIEGYSAYLHPVGDDLLIGVGQDATAEGRTKGTQVSLFDVSDPAAPQRLHQYAVTDGTSEAEYDHHAFQWWAPSDLALLPIESWSFDEATGRESHRSGVLGLTVDPAGIAERGFVSHPTAGPDDWAGPVRRSVVVGETLYTLSERGLYAADLATFAERAWLPFTSPPGGGR